MSRRANSKTRWISLFLIVLIAGMELFFFRSLINRDALLGNNIDARLNNLIMEHWYHFIRGRESFDALSEFYPVRGSVSYTDMLLLYSVIYCPLRALGLSLFASGKLTVIIIHLAGTLAFLYLLKKELRLGAWASMLGVICFSYTNVYAIRIGHTQMAALSLTPFLCIFAAKALRFWKSTAKRRFWIWLFLSSLALLAYTGWYTFFFLILFCGIFLLVSLLYICFYDRDLFKAQGLSLTGGIFAEFLLFLLYFILCLIPFLRLYLPTAAMSGGRSWEDVLYYLPRPYDLLNLGEGNLLFGRYFLPAELLDTAKKGEWELTAGFPLPELLLTGIFLLIIIWQDCRRRQMERWKSSKKSLPFLYESKKTRQEKRLKENLSICIIMALALSIIFSLVLIMDFGNFSLWYLVWRFVPGGGAIRAVPRWYFFLNLPLAILTALLSDRIMEKIHERKFWPGERPDLMTILLVISSTALIWISNINTLSMSAWTESSQKAYLDSAEKPPEEAHVIAFMDSVNAHDWPYTDHLNAWMLADSLGIKTVNGYSGQVPENYPLQDITAFDFEKRVLLFMDSTGLEEDVWIYDLGKTGWSPADTEPLFAGKEYLFSDDSWAYFSGEWYECESWGRWMGNEGNIWFTVADEDAKMNNLTLVLRLKSYGNGQKILPSVNGHELEAFSIESTEGRYKLKIPGEYLHKCNKLVFRLENEAESPAEKEDGSLDERKLGAGFISFKIRDKANQ